jgi:hypothetical protein
VAGRTARRTGDRLHEPEDEGAGAASSVVAVRYGAGRPALFRWGLVLLADKNSNRGEF